MFDLFFVIDKHLRFSTVFHANIYHLKYNFYLAQSSCTGQAAGIRFVVSGNARQYIECDGNGQQVTKECPNANIGIGLDANLNEVSASNGIWFSPVFFTCVNTTTGNAPGDFFRFIL